MITTTYIITYEVYSNKSVLLKSGVMKVKNKKSSIEAQVSLEIYLKRKVLNFNKLIVKECKEDNIFNNLGDIFGFDFNKNNPFR